MLGKMAWDGLVTNSSLMGWLRNKASVNPLGMMSSADPSPAPIRLRPSASFTLFTVIISPSLPWV